MTFPSKRAGINLNFRENEYYAFVDMTRGGNLGPYGSSYATGIMMNADNTSIITGMPNTDASRNPDFAIGTLNFPASTEFAGPYVLTWTGNCEIMFDEGTWTEDVGLSHDYVRVSNGRYTGTNGFVVVTYSGARTTLALKILRHDINDTDTFLTAVHLYRLADAARFAAGKVFRTTYLQHYVNMNPGYIRFMNWCLVNSSMQCRWEHRNTSTRQTWAGYNFNACDTYGEITGVNTYAVANSAGSPVAMRHGEVVIGRVTSSQVRAGQKTISAITKANPGVATVTAHGWQTGDVISPRITAGMTQLNLVPCTVTVLTANTVELGIDTTAFTTFTAGTASIYVTLERGGLGAYPVVFGGGLAGAASQSNNYIAASDYKTFSFDKYHVASSTVTGAWIFDGQSSVPKSLGMAAEIMAQFMIELDEMQVAQGLGPTDMWINVPHRGLLSVDPDYTQASHFGINLVDTVLHGANGYDGIADNASTAARCALIVEGNNEDWQQGSSNFIQGDSQARLGFLRWGGSTTDVASYSTLRKVILRYDIEAAFPDHPQIKHVLCGRGSGGTAGSPNASRIGGTANYDGDVWNIWGGDPIDHFDAWGYAAYIAAGPIYDAANLTTLAAAYAAASTDIAREAVCATYVNDGFINSGESPALVRYRDVILPDFANAMALHGIPSIHYEGWWDRDTADGTAEVNAFLVACKASRALALAWQNYHAAVLNQNNAYYPAKYVMFQSRWGENIDSVDGYLNGVEGGALSKTYLQSCKNNKGIYSFQGSA